MLFILLIIIFEPISPKSDYCIEDGKCDKYYHAKADLYGLLKAKEHGYCSEQIEDAKKDMEANEYGRNQGKSNPNVDCEILIEILRPRGLPDKY